MHGICHCHSLEDLNLDPDAGYYDADSARGENTQPIEKSWLDPKTNICMKKRD